MLLRGEGENYIMIREESTDGLDFDQVLYPALLVTGPSGSYLSSLYL